MQTHSLTERCLEVDFECLHTITSQISRSLPSFVVCTESMRSRRGASYPGSHSGSVGLLRKSSRRSWHGSRVYAWHPEKSASNNHLVRNKRALLQNTITCLKKHSIGFGAYSFLTKISFEWYGCVSFQVGTFHDRCLNLPTIKL